MKFFGKVLILSLILIIILLFLLSTFQKSSSRIFTDKSFPESSRSSEFILMGDTGTGSNAQYAVANSIKNYCATKDCEAGFILGDVIYDKGVESVSDNQFKTKFEDPYKDILLPFYIVYGNHDYLGCIDCYIKYSSISNKWKMPGRFYVNKFVNISFYAVDTESFDEEQQKWLEKNLLSDTNSWKIVIGHKPIKTFEKTKIDENWKGRKELKDTICNHADFFISGHSHVLEYVGEVEGCKVEQLVSGGGGASTREVLKPYQGKFFFEDNGFLILSILEKKLKIFFMSENGDLLFSSED